MKRIASLLLVLILTMNIVVNDYEEAEATGAAVAGAAAEALLSFLISGLALSGISPDIEKAMSHVETELRDLIKKGKEEFHAYFDVDNVFKQDMAKAIIENRANNQPLSEDEQTVYEIYLEFTEKAYKDVISDIRESGSLDNVSNTMAIEHLFSLYGIEKVSNDEVRQALSDYQQALDQQQLAHEEADYWWTVVGNTISMTKNMAKRLVEDISKAVSSYVQKVKSDGIKFKVDLKSDFGFYTGVDMSCTIQLPDTSSLHQRLSSITTPYVLYYDSYRNRYVLFTTYHGSLSVSLGNDDSNTRFTSTEGKVSQTEYYITGEVECEEEFYSWYGRYRGSLVYWNFGVDNYGTKVGVIFNNDIREKLKINLPDTLPYGSASVPVRDGSIPVTDVYGGTTDRDKNIPYDVVFPGDTVLGNENSLDRVIETIGENVANVGDVADEKDKPTVWVDGIVNDVAVEGDIVLEETPPSDISKIENFYKASSYKNPSLEDIFPFCIPFDLIDLIKVFKAEPQAPYIEIPFKFEKIGVDEKLVIDFSQFNTVAAIARMMERVGFIGFLVVKTRGLIKG